MNYYTHIIYGPEGNGEWSEGLSNTTNDWLMNADIATLESLMEGYGIDYGYTSDLPVPGLDQIHNTGCVSVGGSIACPPEEGWPEYVPLTEQDTEWVAELGIKFVAGKLLGFGVARFVADDAAAWVIARILKIPVNNAIKEIITPETFSPNQVDHPSTSPNRDLKNLIL